jgi:hypothetical protein
LWGEFYFKNKIQKFLWDIFWGLQFCLLGVNFQFKVFLSIISRLKNLNKKSCFLKMEFFSIIVF